jgi:hypothetical protein
MDAAGLSPSWRHDWRYTARAQWSSAGESLWMRLSKFSLCNRLSVVELTRLFTSRDGAASSRSDDGDLRRMGRWDCRALAHHLEISVEDVQRGFCSMRRRHVLGQASTQLRYCETCLVGGFHAAWFQWQPLERCPLHNQRLRSGCFGCAAPISYELDVDLASSPLRCSRCRCEWVPSLHRAAGGCAPLDPRESGQIRLWAEYVDEVVAGDPRIHRKRRSAQDLAAKRSAERIGVTRPHVLTMMNRLFDRPPPLLGLLTTRFEARRQAPSPVLTKGSNDGADNDHIGYDPQQWPHFADEFANCERLIRTTLTGLFPQALSEFKSAPRRQLVHDGLVAPTSALSQAAAAALGWTVSWLGASHLLASPAEFTAPALGLIGWLARLPLRPASTTTAAWHAQVLTWLRDDLELSAWLWSRVTTFMSSRRFYLLYGEAVSPAALAMRHEDHLR